MSENDISFISLQKCNYRENTALDFLNSSMIPQQDIRYAQETYHCKTVESCPS